MTYSKLKGAGIGHRIDHLLIADWVKPRARVLDIGCGDGSLMKLLKKTKKVDVRGIELSQKGVNACVAQGLSVVQGDADRDLINYPAGTYDYVILSLTLQATLNPKEVLTQMMRIGKRGIVSLQNFGHWKVRTSLLFSGRMPVTENLPYSWYDTPNIHLCTIADFIDLCHEIGLEIDQSYALDENGRKLGFDTRTRLSNLMGQQGLFSLKNRI